MKNKEIEEAKKSEEALDILSQMEFTLSDEIGGWYCECGAEILDMIHQNKVKESVKKLTPQLFHQIYEEYADKVGWETNKKCKVPFDDLPALNQEVMMKTVWKIKKLVFGRKLI